MPGCVHAAPTGTPLGELAIQPGSGDARLSVQGRRWAMWNLAKLGSNLPQFDKLPADRRDAILALLVEQAATATGDRGRWAAMTRDFLQGPRRGSLQVFGLDKVFEQAAGDDDPFLESQRPISAACFAGAAPTSAAISVVET